MKKGFLLFLFIFILGGCAPKWTLDSQFQEPIPVLPENDRTKIVLLSDITGFKDDSDFFPRLMRTILIGKLRNAKLIQPVAISAGKDGRLAVADTGCRCVHLFIPEEKAYMRIFKTPQGALTSPVGVAFDENMRLYISDSALKAVFVYEKNGRFLSRIADPEHPFLRPTGLAYDAGAKLLFVSDTLAHRVYAFDSSGNHVFSFGERGSGDGQFNFPTHIFSSPGRVYVTDSMNFRIQIFDSRGKYISGFGHHGDGSGDFSMPKGVAADKDGIIYVVDSLFDNVQLFDSLGDFLLTIGSRGTGPDEFWLPSGMFIDESGLIYVCDTYNGRLHVYRIGGRK